MSSTKPDTPAPLTQKQILSFLLEATGDLDTAQALQKTLPSSLLKGSSSTLAALDQTARDLHAAQAKVDADLGRLQPLNVFCAALLTSTLKARWAMEFDVEKDSLELPGDYCGCEPVTPPGGGAPVTPPATPTLLEAAMQNFTKREARDDFFPAGSVVRIAGQPAGIAGLTPTAFAVLCRELDLGKKYQQHFQQVFGIREVDGKPVASGPMVRNITALKKQLLQLDLHLALLKEHISKGAYESLERLIEAGGIADAKSLNFQGRPLIMQGIELLDCCIWGVVVFSERSVESDPDQWCLVYMPGEPSQPLYEYASFSAFIAYLEFRLGMASYKSYFTHCIGEVDKADFFKNFADASSLGRARYLPITGSLLDFMHQSHIGKLQIDARALAVPTADVDEEARKKRLLEYLEIGLTVVNVAGIFVPVVGQLMMGVAVGQMLAEVYEGVEDWSRGDREEAFSHLLSVAENIVLMVSVGAGIRGLKTLAIKTVRKHPDFFQPFAAIWNRDGQPRLWKPQLLGYEQALPDIAEPQLDTPGLYRANGRQFARLDNRAYEVALEPPSDSWEVRHPVRAKAYQPVLKRNDRGGWRHSFEQTERWSGAYTLKRMDPGLEGWDDSRLEMARRLSGTRIDELHRLSDDNRPLPPRLLDMIERFGIERRVRDYIAAMERGEATDPRYVNEQLHALPRLANWPADRCIEVVDEQGRITATYPPGSIDDDSVSVIVNHGQLGKGELLQAVIDGLYPKEVEALVGASVAPADASQQLAKVIGAAVRADRRSTFDHLYSRYDRDLAGELLKVRKAFPDLPVRSARDLLKRTPSVERMHLRSTGRLPMGLAQRARQASSDVRVDRALTGFYLAEIANDDTGKLAIGLLPQLSGWDSGFYLELRAQRLNGELLETLGKKPSTPLNACTLVKLDSGYEVYGSDGKSLGQATAGPDSLYHGILKGLSEQQRKAIGFAQPTPDDAWRLRSRLLESALGEHEGCARLLAGDQFQPELSETFCTLDDSPSGSSTHSRQLLRKVRKLYPLFSDAQASEFLDQLGGDHLTRALRVRELHHDLARLRDALDAWSEDEAAMKALGGDLTKVVDCRQLVAFEIEDCFRRMIFAHGENHRPVYGLELDGMRCGKLPVLPVGLSFDHVRHLSLRNMQLDNDVAYFLKAFRQVEFLDLDRNRLTLLPEVISNMPNLREFSASRNQIRLTEYALAKVSRMRTLQSLNLSYNPLGATLDVSHMFDLVDLSVRNTRSTELPKGLARLPNLDRVDLRDNDIRDLPDWLFETPRRFSETINLELNPISEFSTTLLKDYHKRVGVGFGYLDNDIARLDENQARSIWLTETGGSVGSRRLQIWTAINDDPMAEGLFHLLAELGNTAESIHVREDMSRRVWAVLEATHANAELREQIFDLAANPIDCADNAAVTFSHLEVAVQVQRATRQFGNRQPSGTSLINLARRLFRLEQVDQIAAEHALERKSPDPLEVSLAYRTGLTAALDLPGQPSHMRYASIADVTGQDLVTAIHRVQMAELSPAWLKFLVRQPFWSNFVKNSFAQHFDEARKPHHEEIQALFDKAEELSSADYLSEMNRCAGRLEQSENTLLERLTEQVLRLTERGACLLPDA
ncbi:NEL-type E3 ubiquitin ligase domain-containing protein [Pseudomonas gozinkensis]|uniref:NEL-type E3 ubiquitin ligase domain-containing protein n=1 Tax=Pseudomonas gozinkensis TaxID=2774461 RepID=UPI0017880C24|nr:NEL-type E3 ubiquitin ligase domain-containing protein [Pseudomonas gozinkensis]